MEEAPVASSNGVVDIEVRLAEHAKQKNPRIVPAILTFTAAGAPLIYSVGTALVLCVELVMKSAAWAILTPIIFPFAIFYGLATVPVVGWVISGIGLALSVITTVGLVGWNRQHEAERLELAAHRRAAVVAHPVDVTLTVPPLVTF